MRGRPVAGRQARRLDAQPGRVPAARRAGQGVRHESSRHPVHPRRGGRMLRPQRRRRRGARRRARRAGNRGAAGEAPVDARRRIRVGAVRLGHGNEALGRHRCARERGHLVARAVEPVAQHSARRLRRSEPPRRPASGDAASAGPPGGCAAAVRRLGPKRDSAVRLPQCESRQALHRGCAHPYLRAPHAWRLRQRLRPGVVRRRAGRRGGRRSRGVPLASLERRPRPRRHRGGRSARRVATERQG